RRHTRWPRDWSSDVCSSDLTRACSSSAVMIDLRADDEQALVVALDHELGQAVETALVLVHPQAPVVARPPQQLPGGLLAHHLVEIGRASCREGAHVPVCERA